MFNCMYFYISLLSRFIIVYELQVCKKVEAFQSIMAHFKTKEKTCHRSFTTTIGNANFTTLYYITIYLVTKVCHQYINIWEHIYKALHQYCTIRILCMQNKCIDCSPQVCFYNNRPEAIQHTTVSNQYCRQCKAHPSEQDNITSPEWEKKNKT